MFIFTSVNPRFLSRGAQCMIDPKRGGKEGGGGGVEWQGVDIGEAISCH